MLRRLLPLLLLAAACSSKPETKDLKGCDRYADMEVRCGNVNGEEVRGIARSTCEDAVKNPDDLLGQMIKLEADCAQTTTECEPYQACIAKSKQDNAPH